MSQVIIRSIITKALVAWADTKGIEVARERHPFTKPEDYGTFVELHIIPAKTILASIDGERKRYLGDVTCNIWVKDGKGTGKAERLAEEIADLFPVFPKNLLPVSVEDIPSIKRPVPDPSGYYITPVVFSYRAEF